MENYTITKKQILSLYDNAIKDNSDIIEIDLKEYFHDAFKKELEVGKWYKRPNNSALFYVTEILNIDSNHCKVFGFDNLGHWMAENAKTFPDNDFEATPKQVETALINQAKKRGYKKGINCAFGMAKEKRRLETDDFMLSTDNELCVKRFNSQISDIIFKDGKWAEIIPEETKVITMHKAVKILSKKYGKKVTIK